MAADKGIQVGEAITYEGKKAIVTAVKGDTVDLQIPAEVGKPKYLHDVSAAQVKKGQPPAAAPAPATPATAPKPERAPAKKAAARKPAAPKASTLASKKAAPKAKAAKKK